MINRKKCVQLREGCYVKLMKAVPIFKVVHCKIRFICGNWTVRHEVPAQVWMGRVTHLTKSSLKFLGLLGTKDMKCKTTISQMNRKAECNHFVVEHQTEWAILVWPLKYTFNSKVHCPKSLMQCTLVIWMLPLVWWQLTTGRMYPPGIRRYILARSVNTTATLTGENFPDANFPWRRGNDRKGETMTEKFALVLSNYTKDTSFASIVWKWQSWSQSEWYRCFNTKCCLVYWVQSRLSRYCQAWWLSTSWK